MISVTGIYFCCATLVFVSSLNGIAFGEMEVVTVLTENLTENVTTLDAQTEGLRELSNLAKSNSDSTNQTAKRLHDKQLQLDTFAKLNSLPVEEPTAKKGNAISKMNDLLNNYQIKTKNSEDEKRAQGQEIGQRRAPDEYATLFNFGIGPHKIRSQTSKAHQPFNNIRRPLVLTFAFVACSHLLRMYI